MTQAELVERLAEISHQTYLRHRVEAGDRLVDLAPEVHRHDRERAEEIVMELERLGALKPYSK
jgi:hypothetical protein